MPKTVILGSARTPIGKLGGGLSTLKATELGGVAISAALERASVDPEQVDHVVMGQVLQAGQGQIPSRQAQIGAGIPKEVSSETINKVCASGLRASVILDQAIRAGDVEVGVGGGMESMSQAPYLLPEARFGYRMGDAKALDAMVHDGLTNPFSGRQMFDEATEIGDELELTRPDLDRWALRSHERALAAIDEGRMADEIVTVTVKGRKGDTEVEVDEGPRRDTSLELLAKLPGLVGKEGSHTAGNSPGVNDGAGALVLPGLLLLPVKLLALLAIAHGHALSGIATIVLAKVGGAAVVARLYMLTLPALLAVGWFARCHGWFMAMKTRCLDYLRTSRAYHLTSRALRGLRLAIRRGGRRAWHWLHPHPAAASGRHASRIVRVLRRFVVQWRARRR